MRCTLELNHDLHHERRNAADDVGEHGRAAHHGQARNRALQVVRRNQVAIPDLQTPEEEALRDKTKWV